MGSEPRVRRVIVVVLDGLRADAIAKFGLANLSRLCEDGAYTLRGETVTPSVTACAMASLLTGADPAKHGMQSDKFRIPAMRGPVHPVPRVLAQYGYRTAAHMASIPPAFRGIARTFATMMGVTETGFHGHGCRDVLAGARRAIARRDREFVLMHWPDGDRAGHADGWMSPAYGTAVRAMDAALGDLVAQIEPSRDPDTVLVALADHGGGGADARDHNSSHRLDRTIPIIVAGGAVVPGPISGPVSLLDVPATVLWLFDAEQPLSYAGRPMTRAFDATLTAGTRYAPVAPRTAI